MGNLVADELDQLHGRHIQLVRPVQVRDTSPAASPLEHRLGLSAFHQQLALVAKPQDVAVKSYRTIQVADSQPDVINLPNHFFLLPGFLPDSIKGQNERSNLVGVTLMEAAPYQLVTAMPKSMPAA